MPITTTFVIRKLTFDFYRYSPKAATDPGQSVEKQPNGQYRLTSHPNWGTQPARETILRREGSYALMNGGKLLDDLRISVDPCIITSARLH